MLALLFTVLPFTLSPPMQGQLSADTSLALRAAPPFREFPRAVPRESAGAGKSLDLELGASYESLNKGLAPWRSSHAQVTRVFAPRKVLYVRFTESRRFSMEDQSFRAGLYHPLGSRWTGLLEADLSPSHDVVPKWSSLLQLHRSFSTGWGIEFGVRHSEYDSASPNQGILTIDKYWGPYRAAYTLNVGQLEETSLTTTHRFQASYYYPEGNVSLGFAAGRELETLLPTGIQRTDVVYVYESGRHWLSPEWAIDQGVSVHRHGDFYTTKGVSLALLRRF